jgi:hypothetical protein
VQQPDGLAADEDQAGRTAPVGDVDERRDERPGVPAHDVVARRELEREPLIDAAVGAGEQREAARAVRRLEREDVPLDTVAQLAHGQPILREPSCSSSCVMARSPLRRATSQPGTWFVFAGSRGSVRRWTLSTGPPCAGSASSRTAATSAFTTSGRRGCGR